MREILRLRHYSRATEKSYVARIRRYLLFHPKRHPLEMGEGEIEAFLTHLAGQRKVAASTQNQAFNALLFLYRHVLHRELTASIQAVRARRPQRLPTVLSRAAAQRISDSLEGVEKLIVQLLYGGGLRLMECLRLRVKDIDLALNQITVHDGKGQKSRRTMLPERIKASWQEHLRRVRLLHQTDLKEGSGRVVLPGALARKYPNAETAWEWQYVFPAKTLYREAETGVLRRHHLHASSVQKALQQALKISRVAKPSALPHLSPCRHRQVGKPSRPSLRRDQTALD